MKNIDFELGYEPFDLKKIMHDVYQLLNNSKIIICANNYFIAPQGYKSNLALFLQFKNDKYYQFENELVESITIFANDNVFVGKVHNLIKNDLQVEQSVIRDYNNFYIGLIEQELWWIENFLLFLYQRLQNRYSNGKSLINHSAVNIKMGEAIGILEEIKTVVNKIKLSGNVAYHQHFLLYFKNMITSLGDKLAKLGGGISFIKDSIIEMFWKINIINSIYFTNVD